MPPVKLRLSGVTTGSSNLADAPVPIVYTLLDGIPSSKPRLNALDVVVCACSLAQQKISSRGISLFIQCKYWTTKVHIRYEIRSGMVFHNKNVIQQKAPHDICRAFF